MNFLWLEDFLALARTGNFSRAAAERHVTQPAFSRRIRALEAWTGTPLIDRSAQPARLTPAGEWFRGAAQEMLERTARLPEGAKAVADGSAAALKFASTHALSFTFLPAWLRGLEAHAPAGPVQLISDVMQQCEALLEQGKVHFLLGHWHAEVPGRLDAEGFPSVKVGADVLVPVSAAGKGGKPRHALGQGGSPLLAYSAESGIGRIVRAVRPLDGAVPAFTAHLASVLKTMALDGRGIAWLPQSLVADEIAAGRLVAAAPAKANVELEVRLSRHRDALPPAAEAFWKRCTSQLPTPAGRRKR
ncbi:MAG: LysR substrate-binding domain-containing protein [Burkholderiaceae bacterium]